METYILSDDGYADLQWAVSGGDPVSFFKLTESFQDESSIHFVDHPETRLFRLRPGHYEFWVQACVRDSGGYPSCGDKSGRLDLVVDEPPPGGRIIKDPPVGQIRSPSGLTPGRWHNPGRIGHGWSFFWKNRLALPEGNPLHGNAWDLVGYWYTYELRGNVYRPMFAEIAFTEIDAQIAIGTVFITRNGQKANSGSASLVFYNDSEATIDWATSFQGQYIQGSDDIELLVAPDEDPVDNHSHYSGLWKSAEPYGYKVSQGLGWISESIEVMFEDEEGQPSWVMAEGDTPVPGHTDLCFYYISEGIKPGTSGEIRFYENGCDIDQPASSGNRNGFRRFTGFESEQLWVSFQLPGGTAPDEFIAGSVGYPHTLTKVANFHRIFYQSSTGESCELTSQNPECAVNLTWFTDGNYPDASVFVHEVVSGSRSFLETASVMEDYFWSSNEAGDFRFELRMGDTPDSSLMGASEIFSVTGVSPPIGPGPEVPPQPASPPDMTPGAASSGTGSTSGQFAVSPVGGAGYRIPIMTAPGSGGFSPVVFLDYDSHSGNGPLGVGWSIDGYSVISRCAQTFEQDGATSALGISLTSQDRFCLDGERLMVVNGAYGAHGSEYRKERDDHTRVIAYGGGSSGPDHFKVWNRGGVLYEFGGSDDSRIETRVQGMSNVAFVWAQNRIEDTAGNYIEYKYSENQSGPVDFVLASIHYTGNQSTGTLPFAELRFHYESGRDDVQTAYVAGLAVRQSRLLRRVDSLSRVNRHSPPEFLRSYRLDYETDGWGRSAMRSVTECRDDSFSICFEPTTFTWRKSEHQVSSAGPEVSSLFTADFRGMAVGDVNGDGEPDLLITERDGSAFEFFVALGSGSGGFQPLSQRYPLPVGDDPSEPVALTVIDLNADGNQDVLFVKKSAGEVRWFARLSGPEGIGEEFVLLNGCCGLLNPALLQVMDYNGDGLSDIMTHRPVSEFEEASEIVVLLNDFQPGDEYPGFRSPLVLDLEYPDLFPTSTVSGWKLDDEAPALALQTGPYFPGRVDDFYGDGSADILVRLSRLYKRCNGVCRPDGSETESPTGSSVFIIDDGGANVRVLPGGDPAEEWGLVTFYVVFISDENGAYSSYEILGTGAGDDCKVSDICSLYYMLPEAMTTLASDINADGLADVVFLDEAYDWYRRLNTGAGLLDPELIGQPPNDERAERARFIDLTGDGFPEMIYPDLLGSGEARWKVQFNHLGHSFSAPLTSSMPVGNTNQGDNSAFLDFSADGIMDQLFIDWRDDGNGAQQGTTRLRMGVNLITSRTGDAVNVIEQFEDGFGSRVEVSHSPLTDSAIYSRMYNSAATHWGRGSVIYDLVVPFYVVSEVRASAPVYGNSAATKSKNYHYVGAKLQAGGRGLLGFAEMVEWDPQNSMRTHTRYRQDHPFIGLVSDSITYLSNTSHKFDIITDISDESAIDWEPLSPATQPPISDVHGNIVRYSIQEYQSAIIHPDSGSTPVNSPAELVREYSLDGTFKSKTFLTRQYDAYSNIASGWQRKYEFDSSVEWSRLTTTNSWTNDVALWRLGRLDSTQLNYWRSGAQSDIVRSTSYQYHPENGLLTRETSQPGSSAHQVVTGYSLDGFGNRTATSVTGAGMATRQMTDRYDDLGRFITEARNAYGQRTLVLEEWDVFGNALRSRNIDNVLTLAAVDLMGRPFASWNETGNWNIEQMGLGGHAECPAGTRFHSISTGGARPAVVECFDRLSRNIRTASEGFLGSWIYTDSYFDVSGHPERVSEPYFSSQARYWNFSEYDAVGRATRFVAADGLIEEFFYDDQATYCGHPGKRATLSRTNPLDGTIRFKWERRNIAGEIERTLDNDCSAVDYRYDVVGNLVETIGVDGSVISIDYDNYGLNKVQVSDPDKGTWSYASNALGEVIRQLDSKGQATDFSYDLMGRVTNRRELSDVQSLNDTNFEIHNHEIREWQNSLASGVSGRGQLVRETYHEGENGVALHRRDFEFDGLGRMTAIAHHLDGQVFYEAFTYDDVGRPFQRFDASGNLHGIRYHFNTHGYLAAIQEAKEGEAGIFYQQISAADERGNPIAMTLGNGAELFADFDPLSGHIRSLEAYGANGSQMQFVEYEFDRLGNLLSRHEQSGTNNLLEEYDYDELDRLERVLLTAPNSGVHQLETQRMMYDASGNITYKSGAGSYAYGQGGAGPHAVTRVGNTTFNYDQNGNQVSSSDGRSISYSVFDKAERVDQGGEFTEFHYGLGNDQYKRIDGNSVDGFKTTLTIGNVERIEVAGSGPGFRRYLDGVAMVEYSPATGQSQYRYTAKDHLGSIHSISDEAGVKIQENHFGPWGARRQSDWRTNLTGAALVYANEFTPRGFTGHEHADGFGVIQMNGRVYDPRLGRFLQADPFVQAPRNAQNLNRYSYVLNNPLSYTDPSGFFLKRLIRKWGRTIAAAVAAYYTFGWAYGASASAIASGASASFSFSQFVAGVGWQPLAGISAGAISGFVAGAIMTGGLRGSIRNAFAGAITFGINRYFGHRYDLRRVVAEGLGGAVNARVLGAKFDEGLRFALIVSGLNYANYRMRQIAGAVADKNPANTGKPSGGFYGDQTARAGALRTPNPKFPDLSEVPFLDCDSPAGGCQGGSVISRNDVVQSRLGPFDYSAYGSLDRLTESFAGPHDWLRLMTGSYDPTTGLNIYRAGFASVMDGIINYGLIPVAAPFAVAGLITTSPHIGLVTQAELFDD